MVGYFLINLACFTHNFAEIPYVHLHTLIRAFTHAYTCIYTRLYVHLHTGVRKKFL